MNVYPILYTAMMAAMDGKSMTEVIANQKTAAETAAVEKTEAATVRAAKAAANKKAASAARAAELRAKYIAELNAAKAAKAIAKAAKEAAGEAATAERKAVAAIVSAAVQGATMASTADKEAVEAAVKALKRAEGRYTKSAKEVKLLASILTVKEEAVEAAKAAGSIELSSGYKAQVNKRVANLKSLEDNLLHLKADSRSTVVAVDSAKAAKDTADLMGSKQQRQAAAKKVEATMAEDRRINAAIDDCIAAIDGARAELKQYEQKLSGQFGMVYTADAADKLAAAEEAAAKAAENLKYAQETEAYAKTAVEAAKKALEEAEFAADLQKEKALAQSEAEKKMIATIVTSTPISAISELETAATQAKLEAVDYYFDNIDENGMEAADEARLLARIKLALLKKLAGYTAEKTNSADLVAKLLDPAIKKTASEAEEQLAKAEEREAKASEAYYSAQIAIALENPDDFIITKFWHPDLTDEENKSVITQVNRDFNCPKGLQEEKTFFNSFTGEEMKLPKKFIWNEDNDNPQILIHQSIFWARVLPWFKAQRAAEAAIEAEITKMGEIKKYEEYKEFIHVTWWEEHKAAIKAAKEAVKAAIGKDKKVAEKKLQALRQENYKNTPEYKAYISLRNQAAELNSDVKEALHAYMDECWRSREKFNKAGLTVIGAPNGTPEAAADAVRFCLRNAELGTIQMKEYYEANSLAEICRRLEAAEGRTQEERDEWLATDRERHSEEARKAELVDLRAKGIKAIFGGLLKSTGVMGNGSDYLDLKDVSTDEVLAAVEELLWNKEYQTANGVNVSAVSILRMLLTAQENRLLSSEEQEGYNIITSMFTRAGVDFEATKEKLDALTEMEESKKITSFRGKYYLLSPQMVLDNPIKITQTFNKNEENERIISRVFSSLLNYGLYLDMASRLSAMAKADKPELAYVGEKALTAFAGNVFNAYRTKAAMTDAELEENYIWFKNHENEFITRGDELPKTVAEKAVWSTNIDFNVWNIVLQGSSSYKKELTLEFDEGICLSRQTWQKLAKILMQVNPAAKSVLASMAKNELKLEFTGAYEYWAELLNGLAPACLEDREAEFFNTLQELKGANILIEGSEDDFLTAEGMQREAELEALSGKTREEREKEAFDMLNLAVRFVPEMVYYTCC